MAFMDTYMAIGHRQATQDEHADIYVDAPVFVQRDVVRLLDSELRIVNRVRQLGKDDRHFIHRMVSVLAGNARRNWLEGFRPYGTETQTSLSGTELLLLDALRNLPAEDWTCIDRCVNELHAGLRS